jgi:cysteine-rich repeat protein
LLLAAAGCFNTDVAVDAGGAVSCESDDDCAVGGCGLGRCFAELDVPLVVRVPSEAATRGTEDTPLVVTIAVDGAPADHVELVVEEAPATGSVALAGLELHYTPAPNEHGAFEVTVSARDRRTLVNGVAARASPHTNITLVLAAVDDPPVLSGTAIVVDEDEDVGVEATCVDIDSDACVIDVDRQPTLGVVERRGDGLVFASAENLNGVDSVGLRCTCGVSTTSIDLPIDVRPVDDVPSALADDVVVDEDGFIAVALDASEVDGDDVCFSVVVEPAHGGVLTTTIDNGVVVYVPDPDFFGVDRFTFGVGDVHAGAGCDQTTAEVLVKVSPVLDPPSITTTAVTVVAVGNRQPVSLTFVTPDNEPVDRVDVIGQSRAAFLAEDSNVFFTPPPHFTETSGALTVRACDVRNACGAPVTIPVDVRGVASCAVAKLLSPSTGSGPHLLEGTFGSEPRYIAHCEQVRRGGGFELLVKIDGATETYSFSAMANLTPLNTSSAGLDGTEATLLGAGLTRLDDVMVMAPAQDGVLTRAFEATLFEELTQKPRLRDVFQSGQALRVPAWESQAFVDAFPAPPPGLQSSLCVGGSRLETSIEAAGLNLGAQPSLRARLGAHVRFTCAGASLPSTRDEVRGLGVLEGSGLGPGMRFILGRDRDFSAVGEAPDCAAHRERFGDAFLPGVYVVAGGATRCGSVEDDLARGCGDGAIDVVDDVAEQCDDGNLIDGDGCSATCILEGR